MYILEELKARRDMLLAEADTIMGKAAPTDEDNARLEAIYQEVKGLRAKISVLKEKADVEAETAADEARSLAEAEANRNHQPAGGTAVQTGEERLFASFGEQLLAIMDAGTPGKTTDERLLKIQNAASGGNTTVGADGGYLVQKDFANTIYQRAYETGALASRCDRVPIGEGSDGLKVPYINETSRATGSRWGGVQVYRRSEADTVTAKKPKLGLQEINLEDLMGIAYLTGRALRDAPALGAIYEKAFADEFAFVLDDEIVRGTGAGQCLGLLNAGALVTVAKETGQVADTVVYENIINMWARLWGRSERNAVWYINRDVLPQLFSMGITLGTGGAPVFMPAGGISGSPYNTIFGRPVISIEQCATLGDLGDIILADLSEYCLIDKDGMQSDMSMHVRFLYDEQTFRFIMRCNGQPKWASALTPYKGSNTQSPYITLAARA